MKELLTNVKKKAKQNKQKKTVHHFHNVQFEVKKERKEGPGHDLNSCFLSAVT